LSSGTRSLLLAGLLAGCAALAGCGDTGFGSPPEVYVTARYRRDGVPPYPSSFGFDTPGKDGAEAGDGSGGRL
jgi:hypothetical protein